MSFLQKRWVKANLAHYRWFEKRWRDEHPDYLKDWRAEHA
jgi:hypothetical protein